MAVVVPLPVAPPGSTRSIARRRAPRRGVGLLLVVEGDRLGDVSTPGDHGDVRVGQPVDDPARKGGPEPGDAIAAGALADEDVLGADVACGLDYGSRHVATPQHS